MFEAAIACVDYADYLSVTLPYTLARFDRVCVATSYDDRETQELCHRLQGSDPHGSRLTCVMTQAFFRDGAVFRKGAGLNAAITSLDRAGHVVVMDADILVLDPLVESPDPACLYCVPRYRIRGGTMLQQLLRDPEGVRARAERVPFFKDGEGHFVPSGYWHQWYYPMCPRLYDESSPNASNSDWRFARLWSPEQRKVLPGLSVYHLEMPGDKKATNWRGRKTPRFA